MTSSAVVAQPNAGDGDSDPDGRFLSGPQVQHRYGISDVSLWRWLADARLDFPQPALRINRRRFWRL